jgi:TRAP-type C4-dicarboxylate transport system permease small subunit
MEKPSSGAGLLDRLADAMRIMACIGLAAMSLVTGADVAGRALKHPVFGSDEIVALLAAVGTAFTLPHAYKARSHIAVDLAMDRMPARLRRAAAMFTDLLSLALFAVVAWRMFDYAVDQWRAGVLTMNLGLPEYGVITAVGFGFTVFALLIARGLLSPQQRGR